MKFIHEEAQVPESKAEEKTTIADIARAASVAVKTVYLYFRKKHEVYTAVALDIESTIAAVFQDPALFHLPFEETLDAMVDAIFRKRHTHRDLMALLQIDLRSSEEVLQHKHK